MPRSKFTSRTVEFNKAVANLQARAQGVVSHRRNDTVPPLALKHLLQIKPKAKRGAARDLLGQKVKSASKRACEMKANNTEFCTSGSPRHK